MKLPNGDQAIIPKSKITDYLLPESHQQGRYKAAFFNRFGFEPEFWKRLALALKRHAEVHTVDKIEDTPFGTRYTVEGGLITPSGDHIMVRSVWFIDKGEHIPRFVTAYPLERKDQ